MDALNALTQVVFGGVAAIMTGPLGGLDLPDVDLVTALSPRHGFAESRILDRHGNDLGWLPAASRTTLPHADLPVIFIEALLATEDARFGAHSGVDPVALVAAARDTFSGQLRGGSTLTQQLVKNAVIGNATSLERKIVEAVLALRAGAVMDAGRILDAYLSHAWFGRGVTGAAGAARAWFDKPWSEIDLHEAAFLAAILKGPAHYDPIRNPERALARRNLVLDRMLALDLIDTDSHHSAREKPLGVVPQRHGGATPAPWITSALQAAARDLPLVGRTAEEVVLRSTFDPSWQEIAERALAQGISRISGYVPAGRVDVRDIASASVMSTARAARLRADLAPIMSTTPERGRLVIMGDIGGMVEALLDRGFGPIEDVVMERSDLGGMEVSRGDVLAYRREDGRIVPFGIPELQGAVVVMDPADGAILASAGGLHPEIIGFDRTRALRQPGSAIKPFLWIRAMEEGMPHDMAVPDVRQTYWLSSGEIWSPRNFDGRERGWIPLFVAMEDSSNMVAAHLVDLLGPHALADVAELAGVHPPGGMVRTLASGLGASDTTLVALTAGYAAIANGGTAIVPHAIAHASRGGIGTDLRPPTGWPIATRETISAMQAMLFGVTVRGTAAGAFRGSSGLVAGKTGTSQNRRDAVFVGFTPNVVIGVWVGRDDNQPMGGNLGGSRAAAPIARDIFEAAREAGLDQASTPEAWPPRLLQVGSPLPVVPPPAAPMASTFPAPRPADMGVSSGQDGILPGHDEVPWVDSVPWSQGAQLPTSPWDDGLPRGARGNRGRTSVFDIPW